MAEIDLRWEKGFTLVELLIVMAIVSALAAIAIPTYLKYVNRSRAIAVLAYVKDSLKALDHDTGVWPGGKAPYICPMNLTPPAAGGEYPDLTANDIGLFNNNGSVFAVPNWDGPYMQSSFLASDGQFRDPWGMPYFIDYDYQMNGKWYAVVASSGPNKSAAGVHDDDNIYVIIGQ